MEEMAGKILKRVLIQVGIEGITENAYDDLLQNIVNELKAIPMELRVSPKVATTINQFNLGDMVEISMNSEHYRDWIGEKFKIVGIGLNKEDKLLYTIKDNFGLSDEWEENDLTKALE